MKTTIAVALAACVTSQVFAQVKEDTITFSLTGQKQVSVSTSATVADAGNWSQEPRYYKTGTAKVTDQDIIHFIAYIKHKNANYYSTKAKLVLVQGELSGFFNITPDLGISIPQNETFNIGSPDFLDGIIDDGSGNGNTEDFDPQTDIPNSTDSSFVTLANGHHFLLNDDEANGEEASSGAYPVGHNQPWGQIFVKDVANTHVGSTATDPLCENATFYFALSVEECYDCFYMNSFISDASFTVKSAQQTGPPCCGVSSVLVGKGKDRYYLTLSFDNTENNPYLNPDSDFWVADSASSDGTDEVGIGNSSVPPGPIPGDGITPDQVNDFDDYQDSIRRNPPFTNLPYEARFTLNGILTYTWSLAFLNNSDAAPDFVGTASYAASGYGFVALFCNLFTGTATFTEKAVKTACCLDNDPWYDTFGGWYGVGAEYYETLDEEGDVIQDQTQYEFDFNNGNIGPYYTPVNTGVSLTYHHNFDFTYPWAQNNWAAGWPTPAVITPLNVNGSATPMVGWTVYSLNQGL